MSTRSLFQRPRTLLLPMMVLLLLLISACGGTSTAPQSSGPVTLNFWSWINPTAMVALFEKTHPNIKIKVSTVGQGPDQYARLRTAFKAGTGPDVAMLEFQYLPTFEITGKLLDLSSYGANDIKGDYVPWTWSQVSQGSKVYALPQDSGPTAVYYRKDILDKYNLPVPQMWDQFAQEAIALHKADPKAYLINFAPNEAGWLMNFMWQAGSQPFKVNGTNVSIHLDDAAALKVANYWGNLVHAGAVSTDPDFTNEFGTKLSNGTYASWIAGAWAAGYVSSVAGKASTGKWRVAALPQWTAGDNAGSNWGGSVNSITTFSQHPKEAYEFLKWFSHDTSSATLQFKQINLFPTLKAVYNDPSFDVPNAYFGGQKINEVFVQSSNNVNTNFQWSPFQDYVYNTMNNQIGDAVSGKISFEQAMHNSQATVVDYAKAQGFTVS